MTLALLKRNHWGQGLYPGMCRVAFCCHVEIFDAMVCHGVMELQNAPHGEQVQDSGCVYLYIVADSMPNGK